MTAADPRRPTWRAAGEPPVGSPWDDSIDRVPFAFLDLEMTGLDPTRDRVVEICVERVVGGVTQGRVASLVRPPDGRSGNSDIHRIADADLVNAPTFAELAPRVLSAIDGAVVVAFERLDSIGRGRTARAARLGGSDGA